MGLAISIITLVFGSGLGVTIVKYVSGRIATADQKTEALQLGLQALLRDRLIETYNHYMEKGYAPIYAKENFENMWVQYHNLGQNGVMGQLHDDFMALPTYKEGEDDD